MCLIILCILGQTDASQTEQSQQNHWAAPKEINQVPTLTATSSLTVKVHSARRKVSFWLVRSSQLEMFCAKELCRSYQIFYERKTKLSAAWRSGLERRFYDNHDRKVNGSTSNLVSLLRP